MKKRKGFTLVELIVVIAMIAILAGIAVPSYQGYRERANIASDGQLASVAQTAILTEMGWGSITRKSDATGATTGANPSNGNATVTVKNNTGKNGVDVTFGDGLTLLTNAKTNLEKLINGGKQSVFLYGTNAASEGVVFVIDAAGNVTYKLDGRETATPVPEKP